MSLSEVSGCPGLNTGRGTIVLCSYHPPYTIRLLFSRLPRESDELPTQEVTDEGSTMNGSVWVSKKIQTTNVKDDEVIQKIISGAEGTVEICKNREVKELISSARLTYKGEKLLLRPLRLLGLFRPTRVLVSLRTLLTL